MKQTISHLACIIFLWVFLINGCTKDPTLDFEFPPNNPPPPVALKPPPPYLLSGTINVSFTETFDEKYQLTGWQKTFHSEPHEISGDWHLSEETGGKYSTGPSPGIPPVQPAYEGKFAFVGRPSDIACNKWLFTPPIYLQDGDTIAFVTKADTLANSINYLEVRLNERDSNIHIATSLHSVGRFTKRLGEITNNYPKVWTQKKFVVSGLGGPVLSRVAFRYFMSQPEPGGSIGIDNISFIKKR